MEIEFKGNEIIFDKVLNSLDKLAMDFSAVLNKSKIKHVFISGYVAILFGRSRASEDIDIFIEKLSFEKFSELWLELNKKFECLNTTKQKEAYYDYLSKNTSLRFSRKREFLPNMEMKFVSKELDYWTMDNRKKVLLNRKMLFISPIELQIAFKLSLGSEKDIEDARHLYKLFKTKLNKSLLDGFIRKLEIKEETLRYLI